MFTAQRRALALVAVASWLLIDAVRAAGPLLANLYESSLLFAVAAAVATAAGGGFLAWVAAVAGRHFGHGITMLFMLGIVTLFRLLFPSITGGWLVATGLYVAAIALATVVLAARVGVGAGGGATAVAGTSLGAVVAVLEQTLLRTWDAVWRDDALGWTMLIVSAVAAIGVGLLCMRLAPAESSRGWWAYGLFWSLLLFAFANVAFVTAQTEERLSSGTVFAAAGLLLGAYLAAHARTVPRLWMIGFLVIGLGAITVAMLDTGLAAGIALPAAFPPLAYATARTLRAQSNSLVRRLAAAFVFALAMLGPLLMVHIAFVVGWTIPTEIVMVGVAVPVLVAGAMHAWRAAPGAPVEGALVPVAAGLCLTVVASWWVADTYESDRLYSADFIRAPRVLSWDLNDGRVPGEFGGPGIRMQAVAEEIRGVGADVILLQTVNRGWLHGGGVDMVEYLAGELNLPYTYGPMHDAHLGNVVFTSRPHEVVGVVSLPGGDGLRQRGAVAVEFMGATYTSVLLDSGIDGDDDAQVRALIEALDAGPRAVMGGFLGAGPDAAGLAPLFAAGWTSAQDDLEIDTLTTLESADGRGDLLLGRGVEFTEFSVLTPALSDHLPVLSRVATGAEPEQ